MNCKSECEVYIFVLMPGLLLSLGGCLSSVWCCCCYRYYAVAAIDSHHRSILITTHGGLRPCAGPRFWARAVILELTALSRVSRAAMGSKNRLMFEVDCQSSWGRWNIPPTVMLVQLDILESICGDIFILPTMTLISSPRSRNEKGGSRRIRMMCYYLLHEEHTSKVQ